MRKIRHIATGHEGDGGRGETMSVSGNHQPQKQENKLENSQKTGLVVSLDLSLPSL